MPVHLSPLRCVLSLQLGLLLFLGYHHIFPCVSLAQFQGILHTVAIIISHPSSVLPFSPSPSSGGGLSPSSVPTMAWQPMTFYTPAFISDQFPLPSFLHSHFRVQLHPPSTFHKYSHLCDLTYASHSFGVFFPHTSILSFLYLAYFHISSPFIYLLFEVFLHKHQISLVA